MATGSEPQSELVQNDVEAGALKPGVPAQRKGGGLKTRNENGRKQHREGNFNKLERGTKPALGRTG